MAEPRFLQSTLRMLVVERQTQNVFTRPHSPAPSLGMLGGPVLKPFRLTTPMRPRWIKRLVDHGLCTICSNFS